MSTVKKILSTLKSILKWLVTAALVVFGYLLYGYVKDRFFGPKTAEKELLAEIEENERKLEELEREAQGKVGREEELEKEQEKIQARIDELKDEYRKKQEEFERREREAAGSTHGENIDYVNKKYRRG